MVVFHNKSWAPADEGNYAHVAERLLAGQVLQRDVQDVHAGYINFVNAAAFSVFGTRLVSLRYPIAFLTVVQAGLVYLLLVPRGVLPAAVGALALTSLGFVQFLNPTAHWYCLFLAVATICWLAWVPAGRRERDIVTGFLVGTAVLFRQLSGVLLGMGVLLFLLLEWPRARGADRPVLARALVCLLAGGLAAYLAFAADALSWVLLGVWPFPILLYAWRQAAAPNKELLTQLAKLLLGMTIAAAPLITYHLVHDSMGAWLDDTIKAAAALPGLDFVGRPGYTFMAALAARGVVAGDLAARLNGAFWLAVLVITGVLGLTLLRALMKRSNSLGAHPLPIVALFYAIVSAHYQLPVYLFYTAGLTLAAVIWLQAKPGNAARSPSLWCAAGLSMVALHYQAAMPLSRGLQGIVAGERKAMKRLEFDRAGLYVETQDAARYREYVGLIERETRAGDTILAFPVNAELYFLAKRTNPFRFYNTALGIQSPADLDSALHVLRCHPPKLVFYNPKDKYNTAASVRMSRFVQAAYDTLTPLPPFHVFRRKDPDQATVEQCGMLQEKSDGDK
jgi:hypothetical protein